MVSGDPTQFNQLGLVSDHAYEVVGYDSDPASPTFDTFQLEEPLGLDEPAPLTWSDLCRTIVGCLPWAMRRRGAGRAKRPAAAHPANNGQPYAGSPHLSCGGFREPWRIPFAEWDALSAKAWCGNDSGGNGAIVMQRTSGNVVNKAILQYLDSMDAAFNGDNIHKRRSRQSHARL